MHAPHGLFPRPLAPSAPAAERQRVVDHFRLLGRAMAKALQDNRMLDLPLAPAFYKLALGQVPASSQYTRVRARVRLVPVVPLAALLPERSLRAA